MEMLPFTWFYTKIPDITRLTVVDNNKNIKKYIKVGCKDISVK